MFKQLIAFSFFFVIAFVSCQKDMAAKENPAIDAASDKTAQDEISVNSLVSSAHWYGGYVGLIYIGNDGPGSDPDLDYVDDTKFINSGVAKLPDLGSDYTFSYSNISFDIPSEYNISGDSLVFQTVAENPTNSSTYDYDVVLQIVGSQHSAELHFVADAAGQAGNQYYIGNAHYYNLPQLIHYFGTFETIKWIMKKDGTAAYINGKLVYKFSYGAANHIGRVQKITVAGKGYAVVNSVNLLNSFTNKKIMTENFNLDGQSHTIFY